MSDDVRLLTDGPLAALRERLGALYRPNGHRLGIVVSGACPDDEAAVAAGALEAHGQRPQRRLARLNPRPGEAAARPGEVLDFLVRYGHEYAVAWLPAIEPATGAPADLAAITAAAHGAGCAIGWNLAGLEDDPAAAARTAGADFAIWPAEDGAARLLVRPPA